MSHVSRGMLHHLAGRRLRQRCVATHLCASSIRALVRSFSEWAKFTHDVAMEQLFADELWQRGFAGDEAGLVSGLVLTEDLAAALKYKRAVRNLRCAGNETRNRSKGHPPVFGGDGWLRYWKAEPLRGRSAGGTHTESRRCESRGSRITQYYLYISLH